MTASPRVVIGIGANLGDRLVTMRSAVRRIDAITPVVLCSRIWETTPIGGPPQSDFLNAAVLVRWSTDPVELLDRLNAIEAEAGRARDVRFGPRTLDLDVLWIEGTIIETARLEVPHPRLAERAFAVAPLLEVAPDATDPRTGEAYVVPAGQGMRPIDATLGGRPRPDGRGPAE